MAASVHSLRLFLLLLLFLLQQQLNGLRIQEATVHETHRAFRQNNLSSTDLVRFYLKRIRILNPLLHAVIEVNPDAIRQARRADRERRRSPAGSLGGLHGIPVLLKDNIASADGLNTTAGSLVLLASVVPRDAGVVARLRKEGAIILGKASLSEWSHYRSDAVPSGWSARGGQGKNPYIKKAQNPILPREGPCGSSSGPAIAMAANMASVSLGTETDGSILCPSSVNSVVGIKPTVGLTSRSGVIPISPRQDSVGTVSDAVYVLDAIVGYDPFDDEATRRAAKLIPEGGYKQFLKADGLRGKRLGIIGDLFSISEGSIEESTFKKHFNTLRKKGAILVHDVKIPNIDIILNSSSSGEDTATLAEFKLAINAYLSELLHSPVRSLAEIISFNQKYKHQERLNEYGQELFEQAQKTRGFGENERKAVQRMKRLSQDGLERVMEEKNLDAVVSMDFYASPVLAIGGYPGISVPAGYDSEGVPFAICFAGVHGSEPKLIEIAYGFEQATKVRKPPSFRR